MAALDALGKRYGQLPSVIDASDVEFNAACAQLGDILAELNRPGYINLMAPDAIDKLNAH